MTWNGTHKHAPQATVGARRSQRGCSVLARRERGGMGPGIGVCVRLRPGGRGRAQGAGSRWWVPGGPGPVLALPTRPETALVTIGFRPALGKRAE
ncbi:MAG: hypothetical protein ACK58T_37050 [Phycisphaerae bacterium]